jgi:hypothetical protein
MLPKLALLRPSKVVGASQAEVTYRVPTLNALLTRTPPLFFSWNVQSGHLQLEAIQDSIGTRRVMILSLVCNLVCDFAINDHGLLSNYALPTFITEGLLVLLEKMGEGQSGSHIDGAMKELEGAEEQDARRGF